MVKLELKAHFRPEFLNRVDDIIIFHSLDEKHLARIVDIQLQRLEKRLAQQQLTLEVDRSAKQLIAKEGFDPQFGARPLKRAIQDLLLDPLATKLLLGEFKPATASRWSPTTANWSSRRSRGTSENYSGARTGATARVYNSNSLKVLCRVVGGRVKANHCFAGFGVAEVFARQACDGVRIAAQGINRIVELPGSVFFLLDERIVSQDLLAPPLVLLNERQVPDRHAKQPGDE